MTDNWDDYADGWDNNEAVVLYSQKAYESLLKTVDIKGLNVFDFGCGTGLLTEQIAAQAKLVVALDPSEKMLNVLKNKKLKNVRTVKNVLTQNIINTEKNILGSFDIIVASSALAFVPNYLETLKLLKQLLKSDGQLIQWDWLKENDESGIGFSIESIESALNQAGFLKYSTSMPFLMESQDATMKVVMAVANNNESAKN